MTGEESNHVCAGAEERLDNRLVPRCSCDEERGVATEITSVGVSFRVKESHDGPVIPQRRGREQQAAATLRVGER